MTPMGRGIPNRNMTSGFSARTAAPGRALIRVLFTIAVAVAATAAAALPAQQTAQGQASVDLHVAVVDENGAAVPSARISMTPSQGKPLQGESDYAGRKEFLKIPPGTY